MAPKRIINFSPGPAKLPREVLLKAQEELLDYNGTGISILEMSHRSPTFENIIKSAENSLRELLNIPLNYKVLFMQSGGVGQFAGVPLNLLPTGGQADYLVTGSWSKKAVSEAGKFGKVNLVVPKDRPFTDVPDQSTWKTNSEAAYLYYCANETIEGVEFHSIPEITNVPLVCDMSSTILSRPIDVSKFGVIFAGAQKNAGCAGMVIVIVREDLIGRSATTCPSVFDYKVMSDNGSLFNTPPCYSVYITKLVLEWIKDQGGLEAIDARNQQKSDRLYRTIDGSSGFYRNPVGVKWRSRMNVVFRISSERGTELETKFIKEAKEQGMIELKGHRSVGGIRISLYNGVTLDDVDTLITFMKDFQKNNQ
jgi:phosphoserine aminotransferase